MQGNVKRNVKRNCAIFSIASKTKKAMCESLILCGLSKFFQKCPSVRDKEKPPGGLTVSAAGRRSAAAGGPPAPRPARSHPAGPGRPAPTGPNVRWWWGSGRQRSAGRCRRCLAAEPHKKTGKPCGLPVGSRVNQRLCQTGKRGITASSSAHRKRTGPWGQ